MGANFTITFCLLFNLLLGYQLLYSQENCDNGIDDDGNGYVDCFDPNCPDAGNCVAFYYTEPEFECEYTTYPTDFEMELAWESVITIADPNQILCGDMDNDGQVDLFVAGHRNSFSGNPASVEMYILNGADGTVKTTFMFPDRWDGQGPAAMGDLDNDGFAELILSNRRFDVSTCNVYAFEHDGAIKWVSEIDNGTNAIPNDWAIADFNMDGMPEVYSRATILDGATGVVITSLPNVWEDRLSIAADILPDSFCPLCQGLEIAMGNRLYSVDIETGTLSLELVAAFGGKGFTSVVDWDLDGDLDILVADWTELSGIYVWEGQSSEILDTFISPNGYIGSRIAVANMDNDIMPECVFKTMTRIYALDNDFSILWQNPIEENGGGCGTPATVFDFNGDGIVEVVHRDENSLDVFEGNTGNLLASYNCYSATGLEVAVVADADNDNEAEIITVCNELPFTGNAGESYINNAHIRMFHSAASPWMPARNVWNQQGYFNVNINNNLSIPVQQQLHHLPFPAGSNYYPLNLFLAQYSPVNQTLAANNLPDAAITITAACANGNVTYEICNQGAATLPQQLPLAMYNGNPANAGTLLLDVFFLPDSLPAGICASLQLETGVVTGNSVYLVVNDGGNLLPPFTPDDLAPIATTPECEMENNIAQAIFPPPPYLETVVNCTNNLPAVSLQVSSYQTGSLFTWSSGQQTDVAVALQNGNYCVTVTNANGNCASVLCHDVEIDPIVPPVISGDTSIASGGNALLQLTGAYNGYQWSTGQNTQWITVTQPGNYAVTVTDLNGCTALASTTLTLYNNPLADTLLYSYVLSNAFTPNHDGVNDTFTALAYGQVDGFALFIYNRWGNKVFESHHIETNWNGMYKNTPCPIGTYAYYGFITFANGKTHNFQGNVTLLR